MTAYLHRERRHWRYQLRRLAWRITLALSVLPLLLVLLPAAASAAPRCPSGTWTPQGCVHTVGRRVAVWPVRLGIQRYAVAVDPEVQP